MPSAKTFFSDRPIAYHPILAKVCGSVTAALFLSQLAYWSDKGASRDGWIWKTQAEMEDETGLSRSEQEDARRILRDKGILLEERRGVPARMFYLIKWDILEGLMDGKTVFNTNRMVEIYKTVFKRLSEKGYARALKIGVKAEMVDYEKIYVRDNAICHICNKTISGGPGQKRDCLQFDHVIPISDGGEHTENNIKCSHAGCNLHKGANTDELERSPLQSSLHDSDKQYCGATANYSENTTENTTATAAVEKPLQPNTPNIFKLYENLGLLLNPTIAEQLTEAEKEYPPDWIAEAFKRAAAANVRRWNYIEGILRRWKAAGSMDYPERAEQFTRPLENVPIVNMQAVVLQ